MSELLPAEHESLPPIFSPQRFFLDAPKQPPGTCFVLNSDFEKAMAEIERLKEEIVIHTTMIARQRDALIAAETALGLHREGA